MNSRLVILFLLNYLNLLPIFPFDGGRVVELFFFSRTPRLHLAYSVLCAAGLTFWAFYLNDPFMGIVGGAASGAAIVQWRIRRTRLLLREYFGKGLDESEAKKRVFGALQDPRFEKWPSIFRIRIGEILVSECMSYRPTRKEALIGRIVYLLCLYFSLTIALAYGDGLWELVALLRGGAGHP